MKKIVYFLLGIVILSLMGAYYADWINFPDVFIRDGGEVRWYDSDGSNYVGFTAPALAADQVWDLPAADGTSNQVLKTDGSGALGWADAASSAEWTRTGTSLSPTNAGDDMVFADATIYVKVVELIDDAVHTMPTGIAGHGFVYIGDNQERAEISFEADGTVFLECTSANVIGTDTDGYLCIYDDGSGIEFRNRLGSTLNLTINIVYNTP